MKIEEIAVSKLVPYARNPRKNDAAVSAVAASIKEFGFKQPIVIDKKNTIVVGHTRLKAALQLELKTVPCLRAEDLTDQQIKAYRILDNKVSELSEWDADLLSGELIDLDEGGFELDGFDVDFDADLAGRTVDTTDDEVPEAPKDAFSRLGDLWMCGRHRVLCENAASARCKGVAIFTSPPYGEIRDYGGHGLDIRDLAGCVFAQDARLYVLNLGLLFRDDAVCRYWDEWILEAEKRRLKLISWNVWDQLEAGSIGRQSRMFAVEHEWIFVFGIESIALNRTLVKSQASENRRRSCRRNAAGHPVRRVTQRDGSRRYSTVGENFQYKNLSTVVACHAAKGPERSLHPAVMGIELAEIYVEAISESESVIIDPFLGSGTTLIACERLNRICYGMEIEPRYIDVICQRFYNETGIVPVRESDGVKFPVEEKAAK